MKARIWFLLTVLDSRPGLLSAGVTFFRENDGIPREISTSRGASVCAPSSQVERNLDSIVMGSQNRSTKGHVAFLSLGSNVGDTRHHLKAARRALAALGVSLEDTSACYATEPVDFKEQEWFLNQVLLVSTALDPMQLLQVCLKIEKEMGRERRVAKGPRSIDIDVLLYQGLVLRSQALTIPHPRLHLRRFVLQALAALAPELIHPLLQKPMIELLLGCSDTAQVRQLEDRAP